jgi:hypothetical protein
MCILIVTFSSCFYYINHNEDTAAIEAVKFAKAAFVEQNFAKAHGMLPKELDNKFTADSLKDMVAKMHPVDYPKAITATEFERLPGKKAMLIYLYGETEKEKFYYRLTMVGTSDSGYKVYELYRRTEPYPPSSGLRNQLPVKRSTSE